MSELIYSKALKAGTQYASDRKKEGLSAHLPVLDRLISENEIVSEVSLGIQEIPMRLITGTYTTGRHETFAANFMPLLELNTEFSAKWINLAKAHLNEGIKDPIKCYEYMNHYYVVEGNKRVSVLKYFGAKSIAADVTRLIPKRTEEKENIVYFEFLDFYKICPANYLLFSEPGSYEHFLELAGHDSVTPWTETELIDLRSSHVRFETAYLPLQKKENLDVPVSDAYLTYISIYGYQESVNDIPANIETKLQQIWDEIILLSKTHTVKLVTEDLDDTPGKSFWATLLTPERQLNVAFIYRGTIQSSSWTYSHELGRLYLQDEMKEQVTTKAYEQVTEETAFEVIEKAIADGADVVFVTSTLFLEGSLKSAVLHPKVRILVCSLNTSHRYIRTYYARLYETRFLSGLIAGIMSPSDKVGYIGSYPLPSNIAELNAFALGFKTTKPNGKVYLQWTCELGSDPLKYFYEQQISIISAQEMAEMFDKNSPYGLYTFKGDQRVNLCLATYNWGVLYKKLIESIQSGVFDNLEKNADNQALNYYWGLHTGVVDILVSENVPVETRLLIDCLKKSISEDSINPFFGTLVDQNGIVRKNAMEKVSLDDIINMNWLCNNVIGQIPKAENLTEDAKIMMSFKNMDNQQGKWDNT